MSTVHEQVYTIAVVTADLLYLLTIEERMRLHSRVALANKSKPVKMMFDIFGLVDGKFGRIEREKELPEGTLKYGGDPVYRGLLDAFCKEWEKQNKAGNELSFQLTLMFKDGENIYKDIFKIEGVF